MPLPLLTLLLTVALAQSPFVRPTEAQARAALTQAAAQAKGDERAFNAAYEKQIGVIAPGYVKAAITLLDTDAIYILAFGPVASLQLAGAGQVRKLEPVTDLPWVPGITVGVEVRQIDAPDIVKIVVTRAGTMVEPVAVGLAATEQTTRMGAKTILHEGANIYPLAAFDPGAEVVITIIPASGSNLTRKLADKELRKLQ